LDCSDEDENAWEVIHRFRSAASPQPKDFVLAHDSGRKRIAWGEARLCERNPGSIVFESLAREAGDRYVLPAIDGCRPLHGLTNNLSLYLGFRSQSLASPQALCFGLLRRLTRSLI
jgi:hypothetical protein